MTVKQPPVYLSNYHQEGPTGRGRHFRRNYCGAIILLATALAPQLILNDCADACAASNLAILIAIAQALSKYD